MTVVINGRFLLSSFGGARRFAIELTEGLAKLRDDVLLVVPPLPGDVAVPDVPFQQIGRFGGPIWEQLELPRWLRAHGRPLLLNPATIAPVAYSRQISVVHDIAPALRPQDFTLLFRLQWRLSVRYGMLRRGQRLVTISDASRREISECFGVQGSRIEMVYAGADTLAADFLRGAAPAASRPIFLVFGRHGAAKNVRTVIDAVVELPAASSIAIRFIGKLDPALEPYAAQRGAPAEQLEWRGPVSDEELTDEYRGATGFVWPSLHEGFGIPPIEAQSLGVPVIASDIPINREVLGDSALFFPPTDPRALADAMARLVEDAALRADLVARGSANAERFTWANTAAGWNELIEQEQEQEVAAQ